jgi:hypothetical protein
MVVNFLTHFVICKKRKLNFKKESGVNLTKFSFSEKIPQIFDILWFKRKNQKKK